MAVTDFFGDFDIPIFQAYGMSETTGVSCLNYEGTQYLIKTQLYVYR